ncbi:MAG: phosphorylase [Anaerolineae bacterium]|nr:phosphorylase [Anaerolineae bacterium]
METIGLIAAMPQEIKPVLRRVGKRERTTLGPFSCYRFQLANLDCLLVESGIGLKRAIAATRELLSAARPSLLVSFGVAGAVRNDLRVGDVVLASGACLLDEGIPGAVLPLAPFTNAARQAATQAMKRRGARLVAGTALTTLGPQVVRDLPPATAYPVLEMETAGIAQLAAEQGIPLFALRAVSDLVEDGLPLSIQELTGEGLTPRIGKIVKSVLRRPRIIPQLVRLAWHVEQAAENLAIALLAILGSI